MARASHEVKIRLTAEDRASKSLASARKSIDDTKGSLESFEKSTKVADESATKFSSSLKTGLVAASIAAAGAVYGLAKAFKAGFSAMLEAEKGNRALAIALKKTDDATKENIAGLKAQANAIQATTRYTADSITQTQAFLKQLGVQTSQLKLATLATIDMSESLGMNLESAARNVGKTVGGFAGELGELIPELKELDAEALKSGEGILLLAEKFKGAAKAAGSEGLEGALEQLNNEFNDAKKSFAIGVTGAQDFEAAVRGATDGLRESQSAIEDTGRFWSIVLGKPLGVVKDLLQIVGHVIQTQTTPALAEVTEATQEAADKQAIYERRLKDASDAEKKRVETIKALDLGYKSLGDRMDRLNALQERDARVNSEANDRAKEVTATLKEMGIVTETQVNTAIQNQINKLEQVRIAYDQQLRDATGRRIVDAKALAEAERETARAIAELRGEVKETGSAIDETNSKYTGMKGAAEQAAGGVNTLTQALNANTAAAQLNRNAQAFSDAGYNVSGSSGDRIQLSGGYTGLVGGVPTTLTTYGGTRLNRPPRRIQLPGGGSRLIR